MSEKRFSIESTATELELYDEDIQIAEFPHYEWVAKSVDYIVDLLNDLNDENEQLKQELRGMNELLESYRETIKHDAELLADATRNGYLPPLEDFVKR